MRGELLGDMLGAAGAGAVGEEGGDDIAGAYLVGGNDGEVGVVHAVGQRPVAVGAGGCGAFGEQ